MGEGVRTTPTHDALDLQKNVLALEMWGHLSADDQKDHGFRIAHVSAYYGLRIAG